MPKTGTAPSIKVNVLVLIVEGFIFSLKTTVILLSMATQVAVGLVERTVGMGSGSWFKSGGNPPV